jgi:hypothetical protein
VISTSIGIAIAFGSVALVALDPLWVRLGRSYWRFTPMLRRLRLSPRLRQGANLHYLLKATAFVWGCPIEWRRGPHGIEFHGRGVVHQWLGCGRIVDPDGEGWVSVEFPFRQHLLLPLALANVILVGPFGWPVAAGLLLSVVCGFLVQRTFAHRVELAARSLSQAARARAQAS